MRKDKAVSATMLINKISQNRTSEGSNNYRMLIVTIRTKIRVIYMANEASVPGRC